MSIDGGAVQLGAVTARWLQPGLGHGSYSRTPLSAPRTLTLPLPIMTSAVFSNELIWHKREERGVTLPDCPVSVCGVLIVGCLTAQRCRAQVTGAAGRAVLRGAVRRR